MRGLFAALPWFILALGGCFGGADVVAPTTASAFLTLDSEPRAAVYVDGTLIGNTPQRKVAVEPGAHEVRLECVSCEQPQQRTLAVELEAREIYTHDCTRFDTGAAAGVAPERAFITVYSRPWSSIYLDGTLIGHTPKQDYPVEPGTHEIVMQCGACAEPATHTETFTVAEGETWSNVRVRFEEGELGGVDGAESIEQMGTSRLRVDTEPWSKISMDGVDMGRTPLDLDGIAPGEHELIVRCGPCVDPDEEHLIFNVAPGETHRVEFEFQP
jgi:hypothetical protein